MGKAMVFSMNRPCLKAFLMTERVDGPPLLHALREINVIQRYIDKSDRKDEREAVTISFFECIQGDRFTMFLLISTGEIEIPRVLSKISSMTESPQCLSSSLIILW